LRDLEKDSLSCIIFFMNNVQVVLMKYHLYFIIKMIIRLDFQKLYLKLDLVEFYFCPLNPI